MSAPGPVRVGITLPSFVTDPAEVHAVAAAAEAAGLDGVFVYDHLFRVAADGTRRPALESTALLGAVAASTRALTVGVLVERAALRPPAVTALTFDTVGRIAPGRFVGAVGAGDGESAAENVEFGVPFGTFAARIDRLRATVRACRDGGSPVWVGGLHPEVRALAAAEADGWNRWGGTVEEFAVQAAAVSGAAARSPFVCSWGGLVVLGPDDDAARAKAERLAARPGTIVGGPSAVADAFAAYAAGGAGWVIAGPVDSRDPANATLLGEVRRLLVRPAPPPVRPRA